MGFFFIAFGGSLVLERGGIEEKGWGRRGVRGSRYCSIDGLRRWRK